MRRRHLILTRLILINYCFVLSTQQAMRRVAKDRYKLTKLEKNENIRNDKWKTLLSSQSFHFSFQIFYSFRNKWISLALIKCIETIFFISKENFFPNAHLACSNQVLKPKIQAFIKLNITNYLKNVSDFSKSYKYRMDMSCTTKDVPCAYNTNLWTKYPQKKRKRILENYSLPFW